jgi:hypothetical protein
LLGDQILHPRNVHRLDRSVVSRSYDVNVVDLVVGSAQG